MHFCYAKALLHKLVILFSQQSKKKMPSASKRDLIIPKLVGKAKRSLFQRAERAASPEVEPVSETSAINQAAQAPSQQQGPCGEQRINQPTSEAEPRETTDEDESEDDEVGQLSKRTVRRHYSYVMVL